MSLDITHPFHPLRNANLLGDGLRCSQAERYRVQETFLRYELDTTKTGTPGVHQCPWDTQGQGSSAIRNQPRFEPSLTFIGCDKLGMSFSLCLPLSPCKMGIETVMTAWSWDNYTAKLSQQCSVHATPSFDMSRVIIITKYISVIIHLNCNRGKQRC